MLQQEFLRGAVKGMFMKSSNANQISTSRDAMRVRQNKMFIKLKRKTGIAAHNQRNDSQPRNW